MNADMLARIGLALGRVGAKLAAIDAGLAVVEAAAARAIVAWTWMKIKAEARAKRSFWRSPRAKQMQRGSCGCAGQSCRCEKAVVRCRYESGMVLCDVPGGRLVFNSGSHLRRWAQKNHVRVVGGAS
jgi:hypothetical protein